MKILQVSNRVPWPLNEGGTIGIYNFTRSFHKLGHQVYLYCLDGLKHNTPLEQAKRELSKFTEKLVIHPIDTDVKWEDALKNLFSKDSYNVERFKNGSFKSELIELLTAEKFDVIQLEGTFVGPYLDTIRQYHSGIISLRMHNVEYEIWERLAINEVNPIKKSYLKLLARRLKNYEAELISKVDIVVPVSPDDGLKFKALSPVKSIVTIPAGIDTDYWKYTPTQQFSQWYHLGSMEWTPNEEAVEWFLKNVHPLLNNNEYQLHLAGKGLTKSNYANYHDVKVAGEVDDAYNFIKELDVCIVPLLSGSGIRLKILEAMSAGKLVISTTVGAQGIDYEDRTHLLIANTPEEFKQIQQGLLLGEIDKNQIVNKARTLVEETYSIDALANALLKNYQNLIN